MYYVWQRGEQQGWMWCEKKNAKKNINRKKTSYKYSRSMLHVHTICYKSPTEDNVL